MIRQFLSLMLLALFLGGCAGGDDGTDNGSDVEQPATQANEANASSDTVENRQPQSVEEFSEITGAKWMPEHGALLADGREVDEVGYNVASLDLSVISALPSSERAKIKEIGIGYTPLNAQDEFNFGGLPNLRRVEIHDNNLRTMRGLDETPVVRVGLTDVPLSDITPISGLEQVEYLWIRSTEPIERLPDLSGLTEVTRLGIQANPLKSLDGIETLGGTRVILILALVEDVSALERVRPGEVFIVMWPEHQKQQPEIVAEIESYGFDVADTDF